MEIPYALSGALAICALADFFSFSRGCLWGSV